MQIFRDKPMCSRIVDEKMYGPNAIMLFCLFYAPKVREYTFYFNVTKEKSILNRKDIGSIYFNIRPEYIVLKIFPYFFRIHSVSVP